jgi:hypothetical protein
VRSFQGGKDGLTRSPFVKHFVATEKSPHAAIATTHVAPNRKASLDTCNYLTRGNKDEGLQAQIKNIDDYVTGQEGGVLFRGSPTVRTLTIPNPHSSPS